MIISTMVNKKVKRILLSISVLLFWILVWWGVSFIVNHNANSPLIPSPLSTAKALVNLLSLKSFYTAISLSLFRVLAGLSLAILIGAPLAFACYRFSIIRTTITPFISVMKAMPVATFVLILWITLRGNLLPICVGIIMVMPVIFQNILAGLDALDKDLTEVTKVFQLSLWKKMRIHILPSLRPYFFPAIITSIGLAFKSQVAAEIIAYTNKSIGQYIYDATYAGSNDQSFAWAVVIVAFSIGLEFACKALLRTVKNES